MKFTIHRHSLQFACAALLVLFAVSSAHADTASATTIPVGVITITVPAGQTKSVCLPLHNPAVFTGKLTQVTYNAGANTSTLTVTGATWGTFGPFATNPYVALFRSGTSAGRYFQIATNTSSTLDVTGADLRTQVSMNDQFDIVPIDTLSTLFGRNAATAGFVSSTDQTAADKIYILGGSGWLTIYNDGQHWLRDTGANSDNFPLLPDAGFLIEHRGASDLVLTLTGTVPVTDFAKNFPAQSTTFLSSYFPLDTTLRDLKLQNSPGWVTNADPTLADNVYLRGTNGWLTFYHDGTNWMRVGGGAQNPTLTVGTAVLVVRVGNTASPYSLTRPYALN